MCSVQRGVSVVAQRLIPSHVLGLTVVEQIAEFAGSCLGGHVFSCKATDNSTARLAAVQVGAARIAARHGLTIATEVLQESTYKISVRARAILDDKLTTGEAVGHLSAKDDGSNDSSTHVRIVAEQRFLLDGGVLEAQVLNDSVGGAADEASLTLVRALHVEILDDVALSVERTAIVTGDAFGRILVVVHTDGREVDARHVDVGCQHGIGRAILIVRQMAEPYELFRRTNLIVSVHEVGSGGCRLLAEGGILILAHTGPGLAPFQYHRLQRGKVRTVVIDHVGQRILCCEGTEVLCRVVPHHDVRIRTWRGRGVLSAADDAAATVDAAGCIHLLHVQLAANTADDAAREVALTSHRHIGIAVGDIALAADVADHTATIAGSVQLTSHPDVLHIRGLAEAAVTQIAGDDTRTASAGHVGILDAQVTHTAAEHAKQAAIVIGALGVRGKVADDVVLSVEVEVGIATAIVEQRRPVRHAGHVDVGLQHDVVHLARLHVLNQGAQLLLGTDAEWIVLGTTVGVQILRRSKLRNADNRHQEKRKQFLFHNLNECLKVNVI